MAVALLLALAVLFMTAYPASAQEVAFAYGESGGWPLESGNITEYNGTDIVTSAIASGGSALRGTGMTVEEMKKEIDLKLNVPNQVVGDKADILALDYPGERTINQICSIYEHMVGNWSYKSDIRGIEVFQYSNQSLEKGQGRFSGQGDCDDFAILLASLVESVGGTSRIILAYGPTGGHAYTEVYLGMAEDIPENKVQRMLAWLRKKYSVEEINTHTDLNTGDVWLNLDWWKDPNTGRELVEHPGGPFYQAANQVTILTREDIPLQPLEPVNEPPEVLFTISPVVPIAGLNTVFNASTSKDIGGRIESYLWDFGDGNRTWRTNEPFATHIYLNRGPCTVTLTLEDEVGATNASSQNIIINNPPRANFTITPPNPVVGDQVKFDASESYDSEDGRSLAYYWEISNGSAIFRVVSPPKLPFDEPGMHWVNLTVTDKNGAKGYKNELLKINQPPIPHIGFDNASLTLGTMINFSAAASEDLDGKIVRYAWNFGDDSEVDHNKTAQHIYSDGGEKTIRLSVEDNGGAISDISQEIFINRPPIASFSVDPAEPKKGEPVSFNASASSDPDGKIMKYSWDFGEGKVEPATYTSEFAVNTYYRSQEYNITLTVEDDKGAKNTASTKIRIDELANNRFADPLGSTLVNKSMIQTYKPPSLYNYTSAKTYTPLVNESVIHMSAPNDLYNYSNVPTYAPSYSNSGLYYTSLASKEIQRYGSVYTYDTDFQGSTPYTSDYHGSTVYPTGISGYNGSVGVYHATVSPTWSYEREHITPTATYFGDNDAGFLADNLEDLKVTDLILDAGNIDLNLIENPVFNRKDIAVWRIIPDLNYPNLDQLYCYAKINKNNDEISLLLHGMNKSKLLRGMIPSLYKVQGRNATLSFRPDYPHYCYPYFNNSTLIYSLLKDAFNELKLNSAVSSNAKLSGIPRYNSSFADNIFVFGYYITSTAFNNDSFSYHNWPWGTGTDECKYGLGANICDYSTGIVQVEFEFDIIKPKNYYIFGFINNDNGEETQYWYNDNLWLHQVGYGPGSTSGEKFADSDFPSKIRLHGQKTWSANRMMTWMAISADSFNATGNISGNGLSVIDRNEEPDVLHHFDMESGPILWTDF
jgi:PKD repeat protein